MTPKIYLKQPPKGYYWKYVIPFGAEKFAGYKLRHKWNILFNIFTDRQVYTTGFSSGEITGQSVRIVRTINAKRNAAHPEVELF